MNRHWNLCIASAYKRLGDVHLAEDAAQEALIDALTKIGQLRASRAFPLWLKRIIRSKCREIERRNEKSVPLIATENVPDSSPSLFESLERAQEIIAVRSALRSLTDPLRGVARLFYLDQFRLSEICGILEIPMTTAKKRLHDSRAVLRQRLVSREEAVERVKRSDCPWGEVIYEAIDSIEANKSIVIRFARAFRSGDVDTLRDLTTHDYIHRSSPEKTANRLGLYKKAARNKSENWDPEPNAYDRITEGDLVASWPVALPNHQCLVYRLSGDRISETLNATLLTDRKIKGDRDAEN